jgi:superfamily II DNA/RNA helicase
MCPPNNFDSYIHRSGRTGRAGKSGKCITLYNRHEEDNLRQIQRFIKKTIQEIEPLSPEEIAESSEKMILAKLKKVNTKSIETYNLISEKLLQIYSPEEALSRALLMSTSNFSDNKKVSSNKDNRFTFQILGNFYPNRTNFPLYNVFNSFLSREESYKMRNIRKIVNNQGYVFEVKEKYLSIFQDVFEKIDKDKYEISECHIMPELEPLDTPYESNFSRSSSRSSFYDHNSQNYFSPSRHSLRSTSRYGYSQLAFAKSSALTQVSKRPLFRLANSSFSKKMKVGIFTFCGALGYLA